MKYAVRLGEKEYKLGIVSGPVAAVLVAPAMVVVLAACVIALGACVLAMPGIAVAYLLAEMGV